MVNNGVTVQGLISDLLGGVVGKSNIYFNTGARKLASCSRYKRVRKQGRGRGVHHPKVPLEYGNTLKDTNYQIFLFILE